MTEIPEHLRKRAEEARRKAEAKKAAESGGGQGNGGGGQGSEPAAAASSSSGASSGEAGGEASRIPAHLLERSRAAKERAAGGGSEAPAPAGAGGTATAVAPAPAGTAAGVGAAPMSGPDGHTQRLLTVVKSGSIQDVKASPQDKVHVWPHLLAVEFVAALACTAFTLVFSIFVNAPLLELANFNQTPNPSKAPWYFLGLQELLTMFHPMVAGVTIPGMGIFLLILAPYVDRNPSQKPEDRKFAVSLFTVMLMFWAVLVMIGSFFRGPGFNFVFPWNDGLFFEL
jgi:quinol---cytochrome c reductase cytochrome c subunit, bacillus type